MKVVIEVQGLDFVTRELEEMARRGINTKPLMGEIGNIMLRSVAKNFEAQGRPTKWKPISPLTRMIYEGQARSKARATKAWQQAKEKGRRGIEERRIAKDVGGAKILHGSEDLKKSITLGDVTNESVEIGSSLVYARIHQFGGIIRPKRFDALYIPFNGGYIRKKQSVIPARPYLMLQNEDETFILRAVENHMMGGRA